MRDGAGGAPRSEQQRRAAAGREPHQPEGLGEALRVRVVRPQAFPVAGEQVCGADADGEVARVVGKLEGRGLVGEGDVGAHDLGVGAQQVEGSGQALGAHVQELVTKGPPDHAGEGRHQRRRARVAHGMAQE